MKGNGSHGKQEERKTRGKGGEPCLDRAREAMILYERSSLYSIRWWWAMPLVCQQEQARHVSHWSFDRPKTASFLLVNVQLVRLYSSQRGFHFQMRPIAFLFREILYSDVNISCKIITIHYANVSNIWLSLPIANVLTWSICHLGTNNVRTYIILTGVPFSRIVGAYLPSRAADFACTLCLTFFLLSKRYRYRNRYAVRRPWLP